jgi:hypothetical protein
MAGAHSAMRTWDREKLNGPSHLPEDRRRCDGKPSFILRFGYDESIVFFTHLREQLVAAGATDANIVPWLHDCLVPPLVEAGDSAHVAEAMRALLERSPWLCRRSHRAARMRRRRCAVQHAMADDRCC